MTSESSTRPTGDPPIKLPPGSPGAKDDDGGSSSMSVWEMATITLGVMVALTLAILVVLAILRPQKFMKKKKAGAGPKAKEMTEANKRKKMQLSPAPSPGAVGSVEELSKEEVVEIVDEIQKKQQLEAASRNKSAITSKKAADVGPRKSIAAGNLSQTKSKSIAAPSSTSKKNDVVKKSSLPVVKSMLVSSGGGASAISVKSKKSTAKDDAMGVSLKSVGSTLASKKSSSIVNKSGNVKSVVAVKTVV